MRQTHHVVTDSDKLKLEIIEPIDSARSLLHSLLIRLNGAERYSAVLWAMPPGKRLEEVDEATEATEYLQCAGSSEAMTVEIRTGVGDEAKQYVVGRSETYSGEPDADIPWNGYISTVYPDEVFNAEEATELFAYYLEHAAVPPDYSLRCLDVDAGPTTRPR
jgi:hypothetical protein